MPKEQTFKTLNWERLPQLIPLKRIIKNFMITENKEPMYVWFPKQLVSDNGKLELILKWKTK